MSLKKEVLGALAQELGGGFEDAGFAVKVFVDRHPELSRFYWPEIILRPGYFSISGGIGTMFTDAIKPKLGYYGTSPISTAFNILNIRKVAEAGSIYKLGWEGHIEKFVCELRTAMDVLPVTYDEAWRLYKKSDNEHWTRLLFSQGFILPTEFVEALKLRIESESEKAQSSG